jgi:hypothetical protein
MKRESTCEETTAIGDSIQANIPESLIQESISIKQETLGDPKCQKHTTSSVELVWRD